MSIQQPIKVHPIVLRFAGMFPDDLGGYEAHRTRRGGDIGHVDKAKSHLNEPLIGEHGWAKEALKEIRAMALKNHADDLDALERRRRTSELHRRQVEGPKNPWRPTRHGPLREVILTANKEWFEDWDIGVGGHVDFEKRQRDFRDRAVAWLKDSFGDDVIHARADRDEEAYHIHAVIMPKVCKIVKGRERWSLEPSKHDLIRNYQKAQDSVGEWFKPIGLKRGERRKDAFMKALASGSEPPPYRDHVRPAAWRREEEKRLARTRKKLKARKKALDIHEARVIEREAAAVAGEDRARVREEIAARREEEATRREHEAERREAEAETVLTVAMAVSTGDATIDTACGSPRLRLDRGQEAKPRTRLIAGLRRSVAGRAKAVRAFGAAFLRLEARAKSRADETARAALSTEFEQIRAANDAIVKIVRHFPDALRETIAEARKPLVQAVVSLARMAGRDGPNKTASKAGNGAKH